MYGYAFRAVIWLALICCMSPLVIYFQIVIPLADYYFYLKILVPCEQKPPAAVAWLGLAPSHIGNITCSLSCTNIY